MSYFILENNCIFNLDTNNQPTSGLDLLGGSIASQPSSGLLDLSLGSPQMVPMPQPVPQLASQLSSLSLDPLGGNYRSFLFHFSHLFKYILCVFFFFCNHLHYVCM